MKIKKAIIYHNPNCTTSRDVLKILNKKNLNIKVINYMKNPLDKEQLLCLLKTLSIKPKDLIRKRDLVFKTLQLNNFLEDDEYLIDKMIEFPKLINRPIVLIGDKGKLCRPSKKIFDLI